MRIRTTLIAAGIVAASFLPMRGVLHAEASGVTCRVVASGGPIQPATITFPLGDLFADEDIQGTGTCVSLTGDTFQTSLTVWDEYLNPATLTWVQTSCSLTGTADSNLSNPPNVSTAEPFASTGCTFLPGDPSLNALHRAHATVTATEGGVVVSSDDEVSEPWLIAGVGV